MLKKIKVAMLTNNLDLNGISCVVMNYANAISKDRFDIHIIAGTPINIKYKNEALNNGIKIWELPSRKKECLKFYKELNKLLKREKFDIIHVNGNSATIVIELLIALKNHVKIKISHGHSSTATHKKIHRLLQPLLNCLSDERFACSESAGQWMYGEKDFYVMKNGFNTEEYRFNDIYRAQIRNELNIPDSMYLIGHVGRINPLKNQKFLLELFEKIAEMDTNPKLLIVGDGPDYNLIKEIVHNHPNKERIILYGESAETYKIYSAIDVFVFPSIVEGFGIAAVEAQISGLSCVVSDSIPKEIVIGDSIDFLSLDDSIELWSKKVISKFDHETKRVSFYEENIEDIMKYDIKYNAKILEDKYMTAFVKNSKISWD